MKELFKLLSNVSNFLNEKRFINLEGTPEPTPPAEKKPELKTPEWAKKGESNVKEAQQAGKRTSIPLTVPKWMDRAVVQLESPIDPATGRPRVAEEPKVAKAEKGKPVSGEQPVARAEKGTPLDRGKKAGEQLARTEALTPSGEVRAAVNKLDRMLLAALGGSRRPEAVANLAPVKDQIATLANNIRASMPDFNGKSANPPEVNQFLSQVRDVIKDHNPNRESPAELKNKIAAVAYKIRPTAI